VDALLTVDEALARILERVVPLPTEQVELEHAAGRFLAEPATSRVDLPPFRSSAMDGYAVRAADLPGALRIVGHSAAGLPAAHELAAGEAIEISTGAVVPEGADAVVPVELVSVRPGDVEIPGSVIHGDNIRELGRDVRAGAAVLAAGDVLTPARLAALAACGIGEVVTSRRPRVAVVVTGTELRHPGEELRQGQIYESNGIMLAAALEAAGAVVERHAATMDSVEAHMQTLEQALGADVIVTTGGVSVGPHDLVRQVEARLGFEEVFWGVAMRPGKPLAFGVRGQTLAFGLPGNPVSSLVGCLLFVRPAVLALQGDPDPQPRFRQGFLGRDVRRHPDRDDFVRARTEWTPDGALLHPTVGQESHMIVRTTAADAIVHVSRGAGILEAGASVRFLPLD
jgi:molybdopterin molybdotransferase